MNTKRRLPHEQARVADDGLDRVGPENMRKVTPDDTEGHRAAPAKPDDLTVNPGTGGDFAPRRPSTGGELIDENDVEGHRAAPSKPDDLTVKPGTGGDFAPRRPSTGGEFIDENDVEGHAR
jgi:hypothetical protein